MNKYILASALLMGTLLISGKAMADGGVKIHGNVYGGGNLADVKTNTEVNMSAGTVEGHVYGGGKGVADNFTCDKAMVGVVDQGVTVTVEGDKEIYTLLDGGTTVNITNGTVNGNVYGGGEVGRVERNTQVTIGLATGEGKPTVKGHVFGAGAGLETHGYSALVRGNSSVTVQGKAHVEKNVYGGGEMASVGRYWIATTQDLATQHHVRIGMPYDLKCGGTSTVKIEGDAVIGTDGDSKTGHVYGAGQGVVPKTYDYASQEGDEDYNADDHKPKRMVTGDTWEYFDGEVAYHHYLETLALTASTALTIDGNADVKGSAFGGSESGFVYRNTNVDIKGGTVEGSAFGGGRGLESFAEAGRVSGNTDITVSGGAVKGNVYGGGNLGDVGTITKSADYNYKWTDKNSDYNNTGTCNVTISGGTIGTAGSTDENHGNVFGAGEGLDDTFWCEKAIAYKSIVSVTNGTVHGNVYGGGQIGRVETDTEVTIDGTSAEARADIKGSVFGAGAGKETHGYSALVRGDTKVTVQGYAQVGHSVYGGGEKASVGRYGLNADKMPNILVGGGKCVVKVQGNATIGADVFGAGKGIEPVFDANNTPRRMTAVNGESQWETFDDEAAYFGFLETLALATHPEVTIDGSATVHGSVFGGGEQGLTKGSVVVNIKGGTIEEDVYGGGALANTNTTHIVAEGYPVTGTPATDEQGNIKTETVHPTTKVNLLGGLIEGDAYGGGLGRLAKAAIDADPDNGIEAQAAVTAVEAKVYGDITVTLGEDPTTLGEGKSPSATSFHITTYEGTNIVKSGRVFGCNNLNGSPQGDVTVRVWNTVAGNVTRTALDKLKLKETDEGYVAPTYEVAAIYGGGNLASYTATGKKTNVIIETCDVSAEYVYGGGNAAAVPLTDVLVKGAYEIYNVFGGGNGMDKYTLDNGKTWNINPGANVNGNANTLLTGGYVHEAYGGSNDKGTITGDVTIDVGTGGACDLDLGQLVGAGKNADVNGDLKIVMGCKPEVKVPLVFGGADNANVNGDVELTITSGNWGTVVGGNNNGGVIKGHIILNIEETTCIPINIDELYGCGYNALYSEYGYYVETEQTTGENATGVGAPTETAILTAAGKLHLLPRQSADDPHLPVNTYSLNESTGEWTWTVFTGAEGDTFTPYRSPEVNIISCTSIGKVFGGGYGTTATVYGNPSVNINMVPGAHADEISRNEKTGDEHALGEIGDVFGGGNQAAVYGNATVNIGTKQTESVFIFDNIAGKYVQQYEKDRVTPKKQTVNVEGAYITGNVYGGGNLANVGDFHLGTEEGKTVDKIDVVGNTFVNIGAIKGTEILNEQNQPTGRYNYTSVSLTANKAQGIVIAGNVFGGGKGEALESGDGAFRCGKAMVTGSTNVAIGNGTIGNGTTGGNVYGGGEVGRVEENTAVTIGCKSDANSTPVIRGNVFGAGAGTNTHGYSALVRGNSYVTVQGNAKVKKSVYGGGEIASVGKYNINAQGMPESLANQGSGYCTVVVQDNAVIGPDEVMIMTRDGGPDDTGHVFGAGKGILPYEGYAHDAKAWRVKPDNTKQEYLSLDEANSGTDEKDYLPYVETLGLATQTYVTVGGNAFVKGSVYGGSENGYVQHDTQVNIQGDCQIGNGYVQMDDDGEYLTTKVGVNRPYTEAEWEAGHLIVTKDADELETAVSTNYASSLPECASWTYGKAEDESDKYAPHDKFYGTPGYDAKGGRSTADDGHTYYGNVFGGGSGLVPYRPGKWHPEAGSVGGNTEVNITGGHILTNIYGGNELTDVYGKCTVNFGGTATLGVPRTLKQIDAHPVTCYLFGAGKGDQRVLFNKSTNVKEVEVNITGGTIYGSVFGGGEDGHVHRDVTMTIGKEDGTGPKIGTWGTSYVDGNIFGGGRGFGADAYTAGNVAGCIKMDIKGGTMLGSIYGGGRLGSVGYGLFSENEEGYGEMRPDNTVEASNPTSATNFKRGYVDITISGGTIGNNLEYIVPNAGNIPTGLPETFSSWTTENWNTWKVHNHIPKTEFDTSTGRLSHTKGGNVFAGGMGRFYQLDGTSYITAVDWRKLGCVKSTKLTITGGTIKSNVYGGGELGQVVGHHSGKDDKENNVDLSTEISISGSNTQIGTEVKNGSATAYTYGSVFGSGYGSLIERIDFKDEETNPKFDAGLVHYSTKINMQGGAVKASIYGGGEMACVGGITTSGETTKAVGDTYVTVSGGEIGVAGFGGALMGNVYGGGSGHANAVRCGKIFGNTNVTISGETTKIHHNIYGGGAYGSVGDFEYLEDDGTEYGTKKVIGVKGLRAKDTGVATINITGGTIGDNGDENGMVFGSSRGDINKPDERDDHCAWVYDTHVTIGTLNQTTGPTIKGSVYGSGENGHTYHNAEVTVNSGTIGVTESDAFGGANYPYRGNVYGGGCGTDKYVDTEDGNKEKYNPLAGIVYGNTNVTIKGGHVIHNVYGAGAMGSVGHVATKTKTVGTKETVTMGDQSMEMTYGFVLSVPYTFTFMEDADAPDTETDKVTGKTFVNINGGTIGVEGTTGGDVYGAARGGVGESFEMAEFANVRQTTVNIGTDSGSPTIHGSVYGGGEDGHTMENAYVYINNGTIDHSVYGSGRGTNKYALKLLDCRDDSEYDGEAYSVTAGKVYGNTFVEMMGGLVKGNVYGGGKLASIGKGNYSGGTDDYAPMGYGETIKGNLWDGVSDDSKAFLTTGKATVTITGGTVGTVDGMDGDMPTGNVFGGSQGEAAPNIFKQPAHLYNPVFHVANINEAEVIIGKPKDETSGPRIYGSVYGGGQDGHMRRDAKVTVYSGEIGKAYTGDGTDLNAPQWQFRGNVFGAGSGFGEYVLDYNNNGKLDDEFEYQYPDAAGNMHTEKFKEKGVSFLAGCVARFTEVDIQGGIIHRNVYGGGSVAGTGEPKFGGQTYEPYRKGDTTNGHGEGMQSMSAVTIRGGVIGEEGYGGDVYGASRGDKSLLKADSRFTTSIWTEVNILGGTIYGDVYGGGELGTVKQDTWVNLLGGEIKGDAYGGGKGTSDTPADIGSTLSDGGNTTVELNKDVANNAKGCIVNRIFGCNNVNGTPKGNATVHIYKTQNAAASTIANPVEGEQLAKVLGRYDVAAVYGGGNMSAYVPEKAVTGTDAEKEDARTNVIIDGCDLTSIGQVYGGGNAASAPATCVTVNGTYEIEEVFGGGNGKDPITLNGVTTENPGANVGFKDYSKVENTYDTKEKRESNETFLKDYVYGSGRASVNIFGGTIHRVFGGSNTKGNVRKTAVTMLEEATDCSFCVDEAYGGGKSAPMDAEAQLLMACIPGLKAAYGGAEAAEIEGDVTLNITNGTFEDVFGGNNKSGYIRGTITVNIEETGCKPIIINHLYGGGNMAPYTAPSKVTGPTVNVHSFTHIGELYGGGYGGTAVVTGDTHVNINQVPGKWANLIDADANGTADGDNKQLGTIGVVYGGGNEAPVDGDTYVNIATEEKINFVTKEKDASEPAKDVLVKGANITGNVFGGGNAATVTGNTNVVIGEAK